MTKQTRHRLARGPRRGYAMLSVLLLLAVGLIFATIQQRQIGSTLALEQSRLETEDFQQGAVSVMAQALTLLETGLPPSDPYSCSVTIGDQKYQVDFDHVDGIKWKINVTPTTSILPPMPQVFLP